jgi:hypothetical protein
MSRWFLLPVFLGLMLSASAQKTFKYQALIDTVKFTGFYKIDIEPRVLVKSRDDLADIRLADMKGNLVPYISEGNMPQFEKQKFVVFPPANINSPKDTGTTFIAENTLRQPVSTLWVTMNNTAVKRTVNLSGSNDQKNWYAIEEDIPLQDAFLNSDGTYQQSLTFPASNYQYLKLPVNDKNKAPVKFLEAGIYVQKSHNTQYWQVPSAPMLKKDSNKTTYITVQLNNSYEVNSLFLNITGPKYYKRAVSVYLADKRGRELICSEELNSDKPNYILFSARTNRLVLEISNEDNLPLDIRSIKVFQANHYIVSYLEKGKSYKLLTGDPNASAPEYDLKFFTDSVRNNTPDIAVGKVAINPAFATPSIAVKHDYAALIWIAIAVALVLLTFLTLKMVKEVNSKTGGN